jgi:uncharacterized ubiquitin-like protein YukD
MEMVIVEINVPSISTSFDFKVPTGFKVSEVVDEIVRILEVTQNNISFDTDLRILCDVNDAKVLNPDMLIADLGIKDGAKLMLI